MDAFVSDPNIEMAKYPKDGQARKECYFTAKGDTVYAMITELPDEDEFEIKDIELSKDSKITMLGVDGELEWEKEGSGIEVELPRLNPSKLPCNHVFTLKITNVK